MNNRGDSVYRPSRAQGRRTGVLAWIDPGCRRASDRPCGARRGPRSNAAHGQSCAAARCAVLLCDRRDGFVLPERIGSLGPGISTAGCRCHAGTDRGRNGRRALGKHRPTHCCHPRNRASMSPREVLHPTGLQTPRAGRKRRPRSPSPATRNSPNETRFKMPRNIARGGRRRACNHEGRCRPLRAKRNPRTAAQRQPSSDWRSTQLRNWRAHQTSNDVSVSWRSAPVSSAKRSSR